MNAQNVISLVKGLNVPDATEEEMSLAKYCKVVDATEDRIAQIVEMTQFDVLDAEKVVVEDMSNPAAYMFAKNWALENNYCHGCDSFVGPGQGCLLRGYLCSSCRTRVIGVERNPVKIARLARYSLKHFHQFWREDVEIEKAIEHLIHGVADDVNDETFKFISWIKS